MATADEAKRSLFLRMCDDAKKRNLDVVLIHHPEVLGDDYAEMIESLNRLADADLALRIVPQKRRTDSPRGN